MATKTSRSKLTDADQVIRYMDALDHPLKKEVETIRMIIKKSNPRLNERIKWNAPSYYYIEDIVTFGPVKPDQVLLVFHHPFIVKITSTLLEGDYKDRRLVYFGNMKTIRSNKKELERIINELIDMIGKNK